jgi:hypothetical protein
MAEASPEGAAPSKAAIEAYLARAQAPERKTAQEILAERRAAAASQGALLKPKAAMTAREFFSRSPAAESPRAAPAPSPVANVDYMSSAEMKAFIAERFGYSSTPSPFGVIKTQMEPTIRAYLSGVRDPRALMYLWEAPQTRAAHFTSGYKRSAIEKATEAFNAKNKK